MTDDIHTCHADCDRPICKAVREAVREAVAAEREACAKEADKWIGCDGLAAAIRARRENELTYASIAEIEAKLKEKNGY